MVAFCLQRRCSGSWEANDKGLSFWKYITFPIKTDVNVKKKQYFMLVNNLDFRFDLEKEIYSFKQLLSVHYIVGTMRSLERQTLFASGTYGPVGKQIYTWDVQETWLWHVKKLLWYNMIHAWKEMNLMHHYISLEEEVYRIIESFTQEGAWTNKWMVSTIQLLFFFEGRKEGRKKGGKERGREGGGKEERRRRALTVLWVNSFW